MFEHVWNKSTEQIIAQTGAKLLTLSSKHTTPTNLAHKVLRAKHGDERRARFGARARTKRSHRATQSHQFKQELGRLQGEQTRQNLIIVSCFCRAGWGMRQMVCLRIRCWANGCCFCEWLLIKKQHSSQRERESKQVELMVQRRRMSLCACARRFLSLSCKIHKQWVCGKRSLLLGLWAGICR